MCGGGSSPTSSSFNIQNSTSTYTPNPYALSMMYGAMNGAQNLYLAPYTPYTEQRIAGYNQDQLAAMQGVRNMQGMTQPYLDTAAQYASNAVNYASPQNFSQANVGQYFNPLLTQFLDQTPMAYSQGAVDQYANRALDPFIQNMPTAYTQQVADMYKDPMMQRYLATAPMEYSPEAVNKYYNPYQQKVIDATQARMEQNERQQQAQLMAQQARSGAFGGTRGALNRAYLAGQQGLNRANVLSGLEQQGYNQALAAFQQQQAQALNVAQAEQARAQAMYQNQQALGYNARNQQFGQALNQFNQQQAAALNAAQQGYGQALGQYNQQQQQAVNAAQQGAYAMAQLGNQAQQAELQGLQALFGAGSLQQQQMQQELNQVYEDWAVAQAWPYQQLAAYANLAAGIAPLTGGTTNTQSVGFGQQQQQPGSSGAQGIGAGMSALGMLGKLIPGLGSFLSTGGRVGKANGGAMGFGGLSSGVYENPNKIDIYTGVSSPLGQYTDLSGIAYPTDPAFSSSLYETGVGSLLSPAEQNAILEEKWTSDPVEQETVELQPFEYEEIPTEDLELAREGRAGGGSIGFADLAENLPKVASGFNTPIGRSKEPPYGKHGNPLIQQIVDNPMPRAKPKIPEHINVKMDLGGKGSSGGDEGGLGSIMSKGAAAAGQIGQGIGKYKEAAATPEFPATPASAEPPSPPSRPDDLGALADKGSSGFGLDSIKGFMSDLGFAGGGAVREGYQFGGSPRTPFQSIMDATTAAVSPRSSASYQPEIDALSRSTPLPVMPSEAFRNYGKATGARVGSYYGPTGLGFPMTQGEAEYRLPWRNPNVGSTAYNRMLTQASRNIRPTQLTPVELGFPAMSEEGPYATQRPMIYSDDFIANAGKWGEAAGSGTAAANATGVAMGMGNPMMAIIAAQQQAATAAAQAAQRKDWDAYNKIIKSMPRSPAGYMYRIGSRIQPDGTYERIPVRPFYQPLFNRGGAVRQERKRGGRSMFSDPWGALKDYGEDVKAAALAIKEDATHPIEVMQSIINRARKGSFPGGSDISRVMAAPSQYEPMNPSNRGTSRDPRRVNPNDPRVQELAQKYHELQSGKLDTGIGGATNFMNPDIVRGRRGLHSWEKSALNDPNSVNVGKHLFYEPTVASTSRRQPAPITPTLGGSALGKINPDDPSGPLVGQGAAAPAMAAPAAPVNPLKDRLDAQWENRPRFDYANNGAPIEETRPAFNRFSDADLSGGPLNMPRGFGDVAPQGLPKGNGFLADDRGIEEDFNTGVTNLGFVNQPVTAPGYVEPPEGSAGFGAVAPAMQSEPAIANEMPVRPISNMPAEAPVRPIHHSAPRHAAPHRSAPAMGSPAAPEPGFGFDIGDLFGDEQPGSGFDLGDLFKDVEFDLPNLDLGALFNRGGAVRAGYDRGGRIGAKEAFEYLTKELGATPAEAEVLIPAAAAESGFNPQAVHDQGTGYGLFGHRLERRDAMRKSLGEEVSDPRKQFGFALDEFRHRPEHRYVEGENPSLEDIMMAHGAFERPLGYKPGHPEGMKAYDTRRGLTEAMLKGDFGAFENIKGLGGSGEPVVAADRGEGPSSLGGLKGFLQDNRGAISDISDFLLASGFGAMASRNPNFAGALGEGGLRGIEALNAARTSRNAAALQELQAQNLMSEVTKRNFELSEAMRQQRARQGIAGGAGGVGAGAGSEGALPPSSPPAPKIVSEAPAEEGMEAPKVAAAPQAAPEEAPIVAAEPMPVVTPQEDLSRRAPPEYRAETYEREMAEARAEELAATRRADQSRRAGLLQDAKDYEAQAKAASERRMKAEDSARKARETPFPIAGEDLKKDYEATQSAGRSAQDKIGKLEDLKANLESPDVYTGFGGEQYLEGRKAVEGASELIPPLGAFLEKKGMRPSKEGIAKTERVAGQAAAMLKDTVGSLGNGTSNADVALVSRMGASISQSKEGNIKTVNAAIRAQVRAQEVAEFQRRYIAERGGLDANYNTALKKWAEANPMFDREGNPTTPSLLPGSGDKEKSGGGDRKVVRTGKTKSGKSVKQYSDGTIEYGD